MTPELMKYLEKKFGGPFIVKSVENLSEKDVQVVLDFGDEEVMEVLIRKRKGDNGNFRVTGIWE